MTIGRACLVVSFDDRGALNRGVERAQLGAAGAIYCDVPPGQGAWLWTFKPHVKPSANDAGGNALTRARRALAGWIPALVRVRTRVGAEQASGPEEQGP